MIEFWVLNGWFFLTAFGYTAIVAQSSDGIRLRWFPFPPIERSHWVMPVLKVIPTCLNFTIVCFAFNYGIHWFTLSYAVFLFLMVVIDYVIVARPRQSILLALFSHVLSEAAALALVLVTSRVARTFAFYVLGGVLVTAAVQKIMEGGKIPSKYHRIILIYACLMAVLFGSYTALAFSPEPFPLQLRALFLATAILIVSTDGLWALWEFRHQGRKYVVVATYYPAIWCIAMNVVLFARYARENGL